MMIKIDDIDRQILANLQRYDAPRTPNEMAKELEVSPATVRRRVKRLTNDGIVSVLVAVDPEKVGLKLVAVIGIHVAVKKIDAVTEIMKNMPEITWLATSIGTYDIIATARFTDMEHLAKFVQNEVPNIKGVTGIETFLCMQEIKTVKVTR